MTPTMMSVGRNGEHDSTVLCVRLIFSVVLSQHEVPCPDENFTCLLLDDVLVCLDEVLDVLL